MILVLDLGNTNIKVAVFELDKLISKDVLVYENWQNTLSKFLKNNSHIDTVVASNVTNKEELLLWKLPETIKLHIVDRSWNFPFTNEYKTPETLGLDRMVLAAGAILLYKNKDCLIIDAGTCITYDYLTKEAKYLGGAISPGITMRYKALNQYTAKLPLLEKEMPDYFIGKSTNEAIHSGVINGVLHEIQFYSSSFSKHKKNFIIILTGGDAVFLDKRLKNTIFANSNFLLESLYHLFQFHQKCLKNLS